MTPPTSPIPRTTAERAAQDARIAHLVCAHPLAANFPKHAVEALSAVADGWPNLAVEDAHLLVHTALSAVVTAEILSMREGHS